MKQIHILQVEDSADYSNLFKFLTKGFFNIHVVESVQMVHELTEESISCFDLVICDGNLPDGTGLEVINYIQSISAIPIIANSSDINLNNKMKEYCVFSFTKDEFQKNSKEIINKLLNIS